VRPDSRDLFLKNLSRGTISKISQNQRSLVNSFPETRAEISRQYKAAELSIHCNIRNFLESQDWQQTAAITTNWDETLWDQDSVPNLIQLHGRASFEKTLIMPTEFMNDEIIFDLSLHAFRVQHGQKAIEEIGEEEFRRLVDNSTRGNKASNMLDDAHRASVRWLESAKEIAFCGVAMNIYDAELNSIIASSSHLSPWRSVENWNTDPNSRMTIASITSTHPSDIKQFGGCRWPFRKIF
jgi:hypothetical protein